MINVFIAAKRKPGGEEIKTIAKQFESAGFGVVSKWCFGGDGNKSRSQIGISNLHDINLCDIFIVIADGRDINCPGGKHVELGYAIAKSKAIAIIGPVENIYHDLATIKRFDTFEEFVKEFQSAK